MGHFENIEDGKAEVRKALITAIREKLLTEVSASDLAKKMGFTKSNLWYHLKYNSPVNNVAMLNTIAAAVAELIEEKNAADIKEMMAAKEKLQTI